MIPVYVEVATDWKYLIYIITVLGIIGNIITIVKIRCDHKCQKPTYIAILLLAVADLSCLVSYVTHIVMEEQEHRNINNITFSTNYSNDVSLRDREIVFMGCHFGFSHAAAAHVVLLVGVRYYVTVWPLKSRFLRHQTLVKISLLLWLLSCLVGVGYSFIRRELCGSSAIWLVLSLRAYFLVVPLIVIIYLHCRIVKALRNSLLDLTSDCTRLTLLTIVIVVVYVMSAVVYPLCLLLEHSCEKVHLCYAMFILARILWLLNSSVNPLLYLIFSSKMYNFIKSVYVRTEVTAV